MDVIFMDEAMDDLYELRDFLVANGVSAASQIIAQLVGATERLRVFPRMGVAVEHSSDFGDVRDLYSGRYCLRYAYFSETIYILRVWHQKENSRNF